jgi:hypothetical protein
VQVELRQTSPGLQAESQPPQRFGLFARSKQLRPHLVRPAEQLEVQAPFTQTWSGLQALSQLPQWFALLVTSVQEPPQFSEPAQVWAQVSFWQAVPPWQTFPGAPQLLESEESEVQAVTGPSLE